MAQVQNYKELHKVKRKETIFGIARENGLTIDELINANPEMKQPGYELRKGDYIKIPFPSGSAKAIASATQQPQMPMKPVVVEKDMRQREIRVGIMLPLHNENGDGRRMAEYYRGVLMACDSLRVHGISTDIRAWNVAENTKIEGILKDPRAEECDLIIGPLYTKQVKALGDFALAHDIRVLIPFSINSNEVFDNGNLFQVFQNGNQTNQSYVFRFYQRFKDSHVVIIDCNDSTSTKGSFTTVLRRKLEQEGAEYTITNLKSSEAKFKQSFSTTKHNVVVLNTSRSQELNVAFAKLNGMLMTAPSLKISMLGYPEWLMYNRQHLDNFYKFDTYIPSTYYMSPLSPRAEHFKKKYRWNFHQDMQPYHQRYAVTGFDQAFFMIKGLHMYGKNFTGASGMVGYTPLQTPLHFERIGNGGMQNRASLFIHYTRDNRIETINF
jgi:murein DD-endopeptidase MepM/ murein hydrolase activator NlpD